MAKHVKKATKAPVPESSKLMLTLVEGDVICAKEFSLVEGDGEIGFAVSHTDGSSSCFTVTKNPTELEFYGLDASIRTLPLDKKKRIVFKATGLDDRDELPWLEYDSNGPVEGQVEADLLDAWFDKEITFEDERYFTWGNRTSTEYAPGFEVMNLLSAKDRKYLGLCEGDLGGPASCVPCVRTTASVAKFNKLMEARRLPYVMVDDEEEDDEEEIES